MKVDRERIGEEAASLANRHGFDGLSMSDLAQALKVRTPSLYSHVAGIGEVKRLLSLRVSCRAGGGGGARHGRQVRPRCDPRAAETVIGISSGATPARMRRSSRRCRLGTRNGGRRWTG